MTLTDHLLGWMASPDGQVVALILTIVFLALALKNRMKQQWQ